MMRYWSFVLLRPVFMLGGYSLALLLMNLCLKNFPWSSSSDTVEIAAVILLGCFFGAVMEIAQVRWYGRVNRLYHLAVTVLGFVLMMLAVRYWSENLSAESLQGRADARGMISIGLSLILSGQLTVYLCLWLLPKCAAGVVPVE